MKEKEQDKANEDESMGRPAKLVLVKDAFLKKHINEQSPEKRDDPGAEDGEDDRLEPFCEAGTGGGGADD